MKYTIVAATLVLAACTSPEETCGHVGAQSDHAGEKATAITIASKVAAEQGIAAPLSRGVTAYEALANGSTQQKQELVTDLMTSMSDGAFQDLGSAAQIARTQDGDTYVPVNVAGQLLTIAVPSSRPAERAPATQPERSPHEAANFLLSEQATNMASDLFSKARMSGKDAGKDAERSAPNTDAQAVE